MATIVIAAKPDGTPLERIVPVNGRDPATVPDSTAGVQTILDQAPTGAEVVLPFDVVCNGGLRVWRNNTLILADASGRNTKVHAPMTYPWRVQPDKRQTVAGAPNPGYNPKGICAPWLYDLTGSLANPYCRKDKNGKPNVTGGQFGGYDGSTGAIDGANNDRYDGKHLRTYISRPFTPQIVGLVARIIANPYHEGEDYNVPITKLVNPTRVEFSDREGVASPEGATHTVAWCIEPKKGWGSIFLPNPLWKPEWMYDEWHAYTDLLRKALIKNMGRTIIDVRAGSHVEGGSKGYGELIGSNDDWQASISNFDASKPVVNEFQHGIYVNAGASAHGIFTHHVWGTGVEGAGKRTHMKMDYCGRQCMGWHYSGAVGDDIIMQGSKHSVLDAETGKDVVGTRLTRVVIGGPHGFALHAPLIDCVFDDIRSLDTDVQAGLIRETTAFMYSPEFGNTEGGRNVTFSNIRIDPPARNSALGRTVENFIVAHSIDRLHVHGCSCPVLASGPGGSGGYFVKPYDRSDKADICTNVDVSGNQGGPNCKGQVAP